MNTKPDLDEFLRHMQMLREEFLKKLPDRFELLRARWAQWLQEPARHELLDYLHRDMHGLAGAGGTFGYSAVSAAARALDELIKEFLDTGRQPQAQDLARFAQLMSGLDAALSAGSLPEQWLKKQAELRRNFGDLVAHADQSCAVIVCDKDVELVHELERKLTFFGYNVKTCGTLAALAESLRREQPSLVLTNLVLPDGSSAEFMTSYRREHASSLEMPILYVSDNTDFDGRLQAVRAGGAAFMLKPLDVAELIDNVNVLVYADRVERDHVLIVDDSDSHAAHVKLLFEQAGYEVEVVTDPRNAFGRMLERAPDLILMDLYMPGCSGFELAKIIRQHAPFVSIPIVYVSAENDFNKKLELILEGGDDFITKPINEVHLLSVVRGRLRRSQLLRGMMIRDSLTGLLNHTALTQKLELEVSRADRLGSPLTFVMIDVDHFKRLNDTYGHPCGDRALKAIARLLRQRLRRTDVIGRYCGEEFAAVLLGTTIEQAAAIMDEIRAGLANIIFHDGDRSFHVTFSAGLAAYPQINNAHALCDAADLALYKAKGEARNRVEANSAISP